MEGAVLPVTPRACTCTPGCVCQGPGVGAARRELGMGQEAGWAENSPLCESLGPRVAMVGGDGEGQTSAQRLRPSLGMGRWAPYSWACASMGESPQSYFQDPLQRRAKRVPRPPLLPWLPEAEGGL